ncbi:hypothetical protein ACYJ1Y_15385 [Natrialbaceae archaeon A-gly3]
MIPSNQRRVVVIAIGLLVAVTLVSAVVGYVVSVRTGLEAVTVVAITFAVSPASFALYGFVATLTFVLTLVAVLVAVEKIEEDVE